MSSLVRGITSKHQGDFYSLNCLHSFRTENKLIFHTKVSKNKISVKSQCLQKRVKY